MTYNGEIFHNHEKKSNTALKSIAERQRYPASMADKQSSFPELYAALRHILILYIDYCCFSKGRGSTETPSKLFANHNTLGQLTNHNTFRFSEGGPSSNPELVEPFVPGWGERYCNNVNYVKNNAIFEPPSMRACSSTPPKQNQDL